MRVLVAPDKFAGTLTAVEAAEALGYTRLQIYTDIVLPLAVRRVVDNFNAEDGALLVAGSSLTVMSGLRFVRAAHRAEVPVVIVNRGATRGDELADLRVDAGCSEALAALAAQPV